MILFDLKCANDHVFEAWFRDSDSYAAQVKAGEVLCPICGGSDVEKALMAPNLSTGRGGYDGSSSGPEEKYARFANAVHQMRRHVEDNCDYVGEKFAEEARKIHYGETEPRGIYGEATAEEAQALNDEGVEFHRIPWALREDA